MIIVLFYLCFLSCFLFDDFFVAVINIFPPLTEIGDNMTTNFVTWGQKRIAEIPTDPAMASKSVAEKEAEVGKISDRLKKFKEKMEFLDSCKTITANARHSKKMKPMEVSQ